MISHEATAGLGTAVEVAPGSVAEFGHLVVSELDPLPLIRDGLFDRWH